MRLVICHPLPGLRQALIDGLAAVGIEVTENPDDLLGWLRSNQPAGAVLPSGHSAWKDIRQSLPDAPLIALVDEDDTRAYARALAAGAAGVVSSTWGVKRIVRAVQDSLEGSAVMPLDVARSLAADASGPPTDPTLSSTDVAVLRRLCDRANTDQIARELGYSTRQTQRILKKLYRRMGVNDRTEAIIQATRWGLPDT